MADSHLDQSERQQMIAQEQKLCETLGHSYILFYRLALLYITVTNS